MYLVITTTTSNEQILYSKSLTLISNKPRNASPILQIIQVFVMPVDLLCWRTIVTPLRFAVVVRDLFYNQPVRRKYMQSRSLPLSKVHFPVFMTLVLHLLKVFVYLQLGLWFELTLQLFFIFSVSGSPKKVLHSIKKCVLRIALVHPQVLFKVTDIARRVI